MRIFSGRSASAASTRRDRRSGGAQAHPVAFERDEGRVDRRDARLDQVDVADEARDPARIRPLVDLDRRPDLRERALMHQGDAVRDRHRLVLVVGDDHEGGLQPRLQRFQLEARLLAQLAVERRERLVEQQHLRPLGERACERDALALPAGQLVRPCARRNRTAAPAPASRRPARRSRPSAGRPAAARTPHCRRPSGAETARSSGTSCSPAADRAARRQGLLPRAARARRPASRSPRAGAAAWSCRSPRARAARRTRVPGFRASGRSTAVKAPKRFVTCSNLTSAAMAAR